METMSKQQVIKRVFSILATLMLAILINIGITYAGKYLFNSPTDSSGQTVTVASMFPVPPPSKPPKD